MTFDTAGLTEKKTHRGTRYFERNGEIVAKECTKCGEYKELNSFGIYKRLLGGRNSVCRKCRKRYYHKNKDKISQQSKESYLRHKKKGEKTF